jgi:fatty acid synthase subunit alpha
MRRTVEAGFPTKELSYSVGPDCHYLSCEKDIAELRYEYELQPLADMPHVPNTVETKQSPPQVTLVPQPYQAPPITAALQSDPVVDIPDVPLSASNVTRSLIAYKLKKNFQDISVTKSIKEFAGGG